MIVNNLDYKYAIYGIAKSVPYVICFKKYKNNKLCDNVFILADEIDSNHCEKTYVHLSSSDMQNIIAYKRYISFSIKHLILRKLLTMKTVGFKYLMQGGVDSPGYLLHDALDKFFYKDEIDKLHALPDNEIYFSFMNQELNNISDLIKIISDYDNFMTSEKLTHILTEYDDTKIVLCLSSSLGNDIVMRKYINSNITYKIFNSLSVEHDSILKYVQSWCK